MTDELEGTVFGVALDRLRQVARTDLPQLSHEYVYVADRIRKAAESDSAFTQTGYFTDSGFPSIWLETRDLMWTAAQQTADVLWDLGEGLDTVVITFADQDAAAAKEMDRLRERLETSCTDDVKEWKDDYEHKRTPGWDYQPR